MNSSTPMTKTAHAIAHADRMGYKLDLLIIATHPRDGDMRYLYDHEHDEWIETTHVQRHTRLCPTFEP